MLDMLGEDARAAVGKVKSLQSQGATPDQIDAQMMEAARNGLLPISVAFAAQKALQRKNPPAPPPQGTVVGNMLGQLQGIASLPAPTMDTAEYAGGGIVAFDTGGGIPLSTSRTRSRVFAGGPEARAAAAAEAERLAAAAAKGTATPAEVSRLQQLRAFLAKAGQYDVGAGLKGVAGKVTAGGVARTVGGGALTGGIFEGINVARDKEVPTETIKDYYGIEQNPMEPSSKWNQYWHYMTHMLDNPITGNATDEGYQTVNDMAARTLGTAQRLGTFGITGPDRPEEPAAPAAAAKPKEEQIDPATLNLDYGTAKKGGGDPYAGLSVPSQAGGIRAAYEAARGAVGPTDESKVKSQRDFIDEQRSIDEEYELDKPLKAQQAKIAERRTKLDEDYSKSMLTDLGLAFLTKGVMAAGEGKDTLSAMAFAVGEGAKTTKERRERIDQIRDKLDDREATIESQLANMRQNQVTRGLERRKEELAIIRENKTRLATLGLEEAKSLLAESGRQGDNALRVTLARIQASGDSDKISATEQLMREYAYYSGKPGREREAKYALDRIAALERTGPQYQAALAKLEADEKKRQALGGGAGGAGAASAVRQQADAILNGG